MRYHTGAGFEAMRDRTPFKYEINPVPFMIVGGFASWVMIGLAAYVLMR